MTTNESRKQGAESREQTSPAGDGNFRATGGDELAAQRQTAEGWPRGGGTLRAPFPWFGGKRRIAPEIWRRFGDVPNYCEPFAGSLAVLLGRPHEPRTETVNDKDCYLANFWRALARDPEGVAHYCDWPVNEADLHARHLWLLQREEFRERMKTDPDYCDVQVAGWWVWGLCQWIGGQWCDVPLFERNGQRARGTARTWQARPCLTGDAGTRRTNRRQPEMKSARGILSKRPLLIKGGAGINRRSPDTEAAPLLASKRSRIAQGGRGVLRPNVELIEYLSTLSERLRRVRVCCGDFERVLGPSVTFGLGLTAVLLDPPYSLEAGRHGSIYPAEDLAVAHRAREWALENGNNPKLRLALCGYEGEHVMPDDWECLAWQSHGGTAKKNKANAARERVWFSPHCLKPGTEHPLFSNHRGTEDTEHDNQ